MLFGGVIFLAAMLLFLVQPMLGKFLLPWFGGTPAVWTTCMLFFQIVLLLGYLYAHLIDVRLTLRAQGRLHALLLILTLAVLALGALSWGVPLLPGVAWRPLGSGQPILHILGILAAAVGLPFLMLSSTSPLLQRWWARTGSGAFPYRLYALSNAASLLGLLCYPLVIEPTLPLTAQALVWTAGFGLFAIAGVLASLKIARSPETPAAATVATPSSQAPSALDFVFWVLLATATSAMLLAVTNRLCLEVAPVPFLWVLPLVLYLLSFVLCFDSPRTYRREWFLPALAVLTPTVLIAESIGVRLTIPWQIAPYCLFLFTFCMTCHGELVRLRPAATYLTRFYLAVACGGAIGGFCVGILAPTCFSGLWEFHIAVLAGWILLVVKLWRDPASAFYTGDRGMATVLLFLILCLGLRPFWRATDPFWLPPFDLHPELTQAVFAGILALLIAALFRRQRWLRARILPRLLAGALLFIAECYLVRELRSEGNTVLARTRNFYGILRVEDMVDENGIVSRNLIHGQINHGYQVNTPEFLHRPMGYYVPSSGVGLALEGHPRRFTGPEGGLPLRIGVTGLGCGGLAAYARTNDTIRFYEINPAVLGYSVGTNAFFSYINGCPGTVAIVPGDARLSQERELRETGSQRYDVLILDAFSSDSVPVHLLTIEAFKLYLAHLRDDDAIIAVNISNRFLDLRPLMYSIGARLGLETLQFSCDGEQPWPAKSSWILLTRDHRFAAQPAVQSRLTPFHAEQELIWTDQHSDLLRLLR